MSFVLDINHIAVPPSEPQGTSSSVDGSFGGRIGIDTNAIHDVRSPTFSHGRLHRSRSSRCPSSCKLLSRTRISHICPPRKSFRMEASWCHLLHTLYPCNVSKPHYQHRCRWPTRTLAVHVAHPASSCTAEMVVGAARHCDGSSDQLSYRSRSRRACSASSGNK